MPTSDNLTLIEEIYSAFAQGNIQFILDHITEDVDWFHDGPQSIPYAGTFKGRREVPGFFEALAATVNNGQVMIDDWIAQGDKVVTRGRFTATVKANGRPLDVPIAHFFTVRDGKIVNWIGYTDTAGVVEALKPSGQASAA